MLGSFFGCASRRLCFFARPAGSSLCLAQGVGAGGYPDGFVRASKCAEAYLRFRSPLRWRSFARAPPCACASLRQRVVGQQGCLLIIAALVLGGQGRLRLVIAAALCAPSGGAAPNSSFARISSDFPASCCARPGDRPQQCLLLTFQMFFAPVLSALEWSSKSTLVLVLWALFARIWRTLQERLHKRLFLVFEAFFVQFSVHARWRG